MTSPDPAIGAEVARVKAIQDNAERLGLTWDLRPASVKGLAPVTVQVDGDTEPIGAVSMVNGLTVDQRVYVMRVPPSANYVVGMVVASDTPPPVGTVVSFVASRANAGPVGAEVPVFTAPVYTYRSGLAYRATYYGDTTNTVANATSLYRIRKSTVLGTMVNVAAFQMASTVGFSQWCGGSHLFSPTSDFTASMLLTLQGFGGNSTMVGATDQTRYFEIVYAGLAAGYPGIKTI